MEHVLVVVDDTEAHGELLAEAGSISHETGADLTVLSWMTPEQVESAAEAIESIEQVEGTSYSDLDAVGTVEQFARDFANDVFADDSRDIEFDADGIVTEDDDLADGVIDAADRLGSDHVFIVGRERSPTGKALFGDFAQRVLLNFDGTVTIRME